MKYCYATTLIALFSFVFTSFPAFSATTSNPVSPVAAGLEAHKPATPGIICVYPNLGGTTLYVEATCPLECKLLDANGNVLFEGALKIGITLLDTSSFESGRYYLKAGTERFTIDI